LTKEVLFDQHLAELEAESYDIDLAASRILGQRMAAMTCKDTQQFLCDLLNRELQEASDAALVRDVAANMGAKGEERTYQLLERLKTGFEGE
jgi:predicted nucleotidyltransferase